MTSHMSWIMCESWHAALEYVLHLALSPQLLAKWSVPWNAKLQSTTRGSLWPVEVEAKRTPSTWAASSWFNRIYFSRGINDIGHIGYQGALWFLRGFSLWTEASPSITFKYCKKHKTYHNTSNILKQNKKIVNWAYPDHFIYRITSFVNFLPLATPGVHTQSPRFLSKTIGGLPQYLNMLNLRVELSYPSRRQFITFCNIL